MALMQGHLHRALAGCCPKTQLKIEAWAWGSDVRAAGKVRSRCNSDGSGETPVGVKSVRADAASLDGGKQATAHQSIV